MILQNIEIHLIHLDSSESMDELKMNGIVIFPPNIHIKFDINFESFKRFEVEYCIALHF